MAQLLVTTVELTSETWYELVNNVASDCMMLYRSQIHADLE